MSATSREAGPTRAPGRAALLLLGLVAGCPGSLRGGSDAGMDAGMDAGVTSRDAGADARAPDAGSDGGPADAGTDAGPPPCPEDMVHVDDFCIDRYEAPNVEGEPPLAMRTAIDGEEWCGARGKYLCTEAQWVRACRGARDADYPYGAEYDDSACNDDETWISPDWGVLATWPSDGSMAEAERLYQAEPSGSNPGCVSEEGVYDLTGNVAEWVARSFPHTNDYDHVMKGCYWSGCFGGSPPSCAFTNPAHPGEFRSYEAGFRCCRDAL